MIFSYFTYLNKINYYINIFITLYYLKYKLLIYYSNLNKLSALFY